MPVNQLLLPFCSERLNLAGLSCTTEQKGLMCASAEEGRLYSCSQHWSGRVRGCWVLLPKLIRNFMLSGHWRQSRNKLERKRLSLPSFTEEFSLVVKLQNLALSGYMNLLLNSILLREIKNAPFHPFSRPNNSSEFHYWDNFLRSGSAQGNQCTTCCTRLINTQLELWLSF